MSSKINNTLKKYLVGKRGRPRFKVYGRYRSVEGKSNVSGVRFKDDKIVWGIRGKRSLVLPILYDRKDKFGVQTHALQCHTKYVRLIRKIIRGKERWYAQLVQEGKALLKEKNSLGQSVVGLEQRVNGKLPLSSFGLGQRQSPSHAKGGSSSIEAAEVVGISREPPRTGQFASRTPGFSHGEVQRGIHYE